MTSPAPFSPLGYAEPLYYRHSGRFSAPGVLLALVVSGLAALVLGAAYAYVDLYNPCISVLAVLATVAFGAGVGAVTGKMLRIAHVRNHAVNVLVATLAALAALYASWVVWVYAVFQMFAAKGGGTFAPDLPGLVLHPEFLVAIVRRLNEVGVWSEGSNHSTRHGDARTVKGIELALIWLVEATCVVGFAIGVAVSLAASTPYCERCGRWCGVIAAALTRAPGDPAELKRSMEAKDFAYLRLLADARAGEGRWWSFDLYYCPGCGSTFAVTAREVTLTVDKKGRQSRKTKTLLDKLLLTADEARSLAPETLTKLSPSQR